MRRFVLMEELAGSIASMQAEPVAKHLPGKHDQKTHGRGGGGPDHSEAVAEFCEMWIGGTDRYPYQEVESLRSAARVLTTTDSWWPKVDERGSDPGKLLDDTRSMLLALADAPVESAPLHRGLAFDQWSSPSKLQALLTVGGTFDESVASWTPSRSLAEEFATGAHGRGPASQSVVLTVRGLPSIPAARVSRGQHSQEVMDADERVATGRYRVDRVTPLGQGSYDVEVTWVAPPFDPAVVAVTRWTGEPSMNDSPNQIIRKALEGLGLRMSLDLLDEPMAKHGDPSRPNYAALHPGTGHSTSREAIAAAKASGGSMHLGMPVPDDLKDTFTLAGRTPEAVGAQILEVKGAEYAAKVGLDPDEYVGGDEYESGEYSEADIYGLALARRRLDANMQDAAWERDTPAERTRVADVVNRVRDEGRPVIAVQSDAALSIIEDGRVMSQFETGESGGIISTDMRSIMETAMFDHHPNVDPEHRTIYGFMALPGREMAGGVVQYGPARIVLRPEVRERTTMTLGDSLNTFATPVPVTGRITTRQAHAAVERGGRPDMIVTDAGASHGRSTMRGAEWDEHPGHYYEAQVHGGVRAADIERIVLPRSALEYSDETYLRDRAKDDGYEIEIYDDDDDY